MAKWNVPDELDARVRERVGDDVESYVAQVINGHLDLEDDPDVQAELIASTRRGIEDADAGKVKDARLAMKEIAEKHGITPTE